VIARFLQGNPNASPTAVNNAIVNNAVTNRVTDPGIGSPNRLLQSRFIDNRRPANDHFGSARIVSGGSFDVTGSNRFASEQTGEPNHAGNRGGASVWFRWSAPNTRYYTIRTFGSNFDTLLAVYRGNRVNALTRVASNDDAGGGLQSRVRFRAVRGAIYRIAVDGFAGAGVPPSTGGIRLRSAPS